MKRLLVVIAVFAALSVSAAPPAGRWMAEVRRGQIQFNFVSEGVGNVAFHVPLSDLTGLDASQIDSPNGAPVSFQLNRSAGTITFTGVFASSNGTGRYGFIPSQSFIRAMSDMGYSGFDDHKLFLYTFTGLKPEWIRELRSMGYSPQRRDLDDIAIFSVTPDYVRELAAVGIKDVSLQDLKQLRIGDVDAARMREYRALGLTDISVRQIAEMAILGVTPKYINDMASVGFTNLSAHELKQLVIGDISADDVREYRALGYRDITPKELADLGIQDISPAYIRKLRDAGVGDLSVRELIKIRVSGVDEVLLKKGKQ